MVEPLSSANPQRLGPPTFASDAEYASRHGDLNFSVAVCQRDLGTAQSNHTGHESVAGVGGTYPTFISGDFVVKLFGYIPWWNKDYAAERAVQVLFSQDPEIAGPTLIVEGRFVHRCC